MNKRIVKKQLKKALETIKTSRQTGVGVCIVTHIFVDQNGKQCDATTKNSRYITLQRPKIQYFKTTR